MTKTRKPKDPHARREAEKYDDPVASREFILARLAEATEPMDHESLCANLGLESEAQREALRRRLIAMTRDGQLVANRRGVYGLADRMELVKGRIQGNRDGSGFFIPVDGSGDLYLNPGEMQKVFDGDVVLARCSGMDGRGRREGMVVEILQRQFSRLVGRYYSDLGLGILVPANRRIAHEILVPEAQNHGARDGQFVVAEITTYPAPRHKPVARITEILGDTTTPGLEIEIAVRSHELPREWPAAAEKQAARVEGGISARDLEYRVELRHLPFVTIDGEDAKDFDDAVLAEPMPGGGWRLLVAIADVSHYVEPGSPLDQEAQNRGNSVYFPGHVIPMLPESLSNGVCSLKPDEDRLVMVCEMAVNARGEVRDYQFYEAVIHSHARLTYTEVADLLEPAGAEAGVSLQQRLRKRHESLLGQLEALYRLYLKLREVREAGGALDFTSTETRIVFGENRRIREIVPVARTCAHRLIEECMLCANVAAARLLQASGLPVLYRVHEGPGEEKLQSLRDYLRDMGLVLGGGKKPRPTDYQKLLQAIALRPDAHLLQTMVVRSLMQAVYQPENTGHFGLGFEVYTHFTSPIRRYPDLLVHRAIRYLVRNRKGGRHVASSPAARTLQRASIYPYDGGDLQRLGEQCSLTERRADSASYDVINWLKCEYMQNRVGDEFDGTVASVTGFGLFVNLDGIYIEGLVHITALANDYYHFDPVRHVLTGERSNRDFRMGDKVRVRVAAVNLDERKIDLAMADQAAASPRPAGRGKGRGRGGRDRTAGSTPGRKASRKSGPVGGKQQGSPGKKKTSAGPGSGAGNSRGKRR